MGSYKEIDGNLIDLAKESKFDVIGHGCNCFCTMKSGIAPQMADAFGCNNYKLESEEHKGDINKLGTIDWEIFETDIFNNVKVVNLYTQYRYGRDKAHVDYDAIRMCFRKMNHRFKEHHIGLPKIGSGLAGGSWTMIKEIITDEFIDCNVTVINYVGV
jgi:O-acetyl-ADP-ribose deacetylase (regulator of RNase III)